MGLIFFCGLRRAEACSLTGDQFDPSTSTVREFLRKGGGDDSLPYLEVLRIYERSLPHLLCGRTPESISTEFERRAQRRRGELFLGWNPGRHQQAIPAGGLVRWRLHPASVAALGGDESAAVRRAAGPGVVAPESLVADRDNALSASERLPLTGVVRETLSR